MDGEKDKLFSRRRFIQRFLSLLQYNDTGKIHRIRACCKTFILQQALFCVYCPVWVLSVGVFSCWVPK